MPKVATQNVSVYGSNRACWRQEDTYGFTHNNVDYGVAVAGGGPDRLQQIASALFEKISVVLGKTQAQRAAAIADVATIKTWAATADNTTDVLPGAVIRGNDLFVKDQNDDYVKLTITTTNGTPALTLGTPGDLPAVS